MARELNVRLKPLLDSLNLASSNDVTGALTGSYLSTYKGRGLEFGGFRQYNEMSDDASKIDWKATFRAQEVMVREIIEERNMNVYLLLDASNSMLFASHEKMKCEFAIELACTMAFAIVRAGDSVGLSLFTDDITRTIEPALGQEQYSKITNELTKPENFGGPFDLGKALERIVARFEKERALLILISDFLGIRGETWKNHLKNLATNFDVFPIMVKDKHDTTLPDTNQPMVIQDPYSMEQVTIQPGKIKKAYERITQRQEQEINATFRRYNIRPLKLYTHKPFVGDLIKHIREKGGMV